jgi:hypothetical protein
MAEVHVIGELCNGSGFPSNALFCKFAFVCGGAWHLLEGHAQGQTQVDSPSDGRAAKWAHPIGMGREKRRKEEERNPLSFFPPAPLSLSLFRIPLALMSALTLYLSLSLSLSLSPFNANVCGFKGQKEGEGEEESRDSIFLSVVVVTLLRCLR